MRNHDWDDFGRRMRASFGRQRDGNGAQAEAVGEAIEAVFDLFGGAGRRHHRGPHGRPHGPGGRRGRVLSADELQLVILHLLDQAPRHGYDLIRAIGEMTGGAYEPSPGMVYPTLSLLEEMGFVAGRDSDGPRKEVDITDEGRAHLGDQRPTVDPVLDRLQAMGERNEDAAPRSDARGETAIVKRALLNLTMATRNRAKQADRATMLAIADRLDAAAREIERLDDR